MGSATPTSPTSSSTFVQNIYTETIVICCCYSFLNILVFVLTIGGNVLHVGVAPRPFEISA